MSYMIRELCSQLAPVIVGDEMVLKIGDIPCYRFPCHLIVSIKLSVVNVETIYVHISMPFSHYIIALYDAD